MPNELKPCPFCNGKAEFFYIGRVVGIVRCTKCRVSQSVLQVKEDAINAWNRREYNAE